MKKVSYRQLLRQILSLEDSPKKIAASFAVGVFISISPFFGFHTILAVTLSILFKLNKVATITGSWINNPWTTPAVYYLDYKIGAFILNDSSRFNLRPFSFEHYLHDGKNAFWDIFVGSIAFGMVVSIVSYFLIKYIVERYKKRQGVFDVST
ncbi:DUF2062 domain-containing protein [Hippea maritima]|uniref:DUF2062 domain-containing protein n=1 Tax=Hippea maritima (strain ATCC 700847 / DSM 10411 / MH2) TaxID=760142 RepID=F2LVX5_HIPMA|nr:DUF2062 domain-containing protein [Hippea maritima]AEA33909.1 Protein of unknown function DUF2062 [Hippea maritima DSM 10411]